MTDVQSDTILPSERKPAPQLPPKPALTKRGRVSIEVNIRTTTPILGGGVETRTVDHIDVLRPGSIRGHLRFWWRALEGHKFATATTAALYAAESHLWGCANGDNDGGRSPVEIRVIVTNKSTITNDRINNSGADGYALWPARAEDDRPVAPRRAAGVKARLTITCPAADRETVERTVRAWILFGGVGGRTRRGVGSLTCVAPVEWLPEVRPVADPDDYDDKEFDRIQKRNAHAVIQSINSKLGDIFFSSSPSTSFPVLADARLVVGFEDNQLRAFKTAEEAWQVALRWLRDFRQGEHIARDPRPSRDNIPAGRSKWPEADKMRRLLRYAPYRVPRYSATPAWPRAGFGLPIIGQFKPNDVAAGDPQGAFEINWGVSQGDELEAMERMASPLIVKAMPVKNGYLACALWLNRAYPPGEVGLVQPSNGRRRLRGGSTAPFDQLIAPGDTSLLSTIPVGSSSLRDAFIDWVAESDKKQKDKKNNAWRLS